MSLKNNESGGKSMNPVIIEKVIDAFKNFLSLSEKLIETSSPEKFAKGVEDLNKSVNDTYVQMKQIVMNDDTLSADVKLKKLDEIAKKQQAAVDKCEKAVSDNRKNVMEVILTITGGLLTCGVTLLPKMAKEMKKALKNTDVKELNIIEAEVTVVENENPDENE